MADYLKYVQGLQAEAAEVVATGNRKAMLREIRLALKGTMVNPKVDVLLDGLEAELNKDIEPGDAATVLMWSDKHAATVVSYEAGRLVVREDKATRTDDNGMSDTQSYTYEPDPNGREHTYKWDERVGWYEGKKSDPSTRLALGYRRTYFDYSF
jgi:hypothetical protein